VDVRHAVLVAVLLAVLIVLGALAPFRYGPAFGQQQRGGRGGEIEQIANLVFAEVDPIDPLGVLARKPHLHSWRCQIAPSRNRLRRKPKTHR
jgi:hypothetical protein